MKLPEGYTLKLSGANGAATARRFAVSGGEAAFPPDFGEKSENPHYGDSPYSERPTSAHIVQCRRTPCGAARSYAAAFLLSAADRSRTAGAARRRVAGIGARNPFQPAALPNRAVKILEKICAKNFALCDRVTVIRPKMWCNRINEGHWTPSEPIND